MFIRVLYLLFKTLNLFHHTPAPNEIIMLKWNTLQTVTNGNRSRPFVATKTSSKVVIVSNWFPLMKNIRTTISLMIGAYARAVTAEIISDYIYFW